MSCEAVVRVTNLNKFNRTELPAAIADQLEEVARRLRAGQGSVRITNDLYDGVDDGGPMTIVGVPYVTADEVQA